MGGTLIDRFYSLCPEKITNFYVLLLYISDHFLLNIKLKSCSSIKNYSKNKNRYIQDFSKNNTNKILTNVSHILNKHETDKITKSKNSMTSKFYY